MITQCLEFISGIKNLGGYLATERSFFDDIRLMVQSGNYFVQ